MVTPFDAAIAFHRNKVNLPTKSYKDLQGGMHSRAFVVAGAMKESLLADMHSAIDKALASGTTLEDFRKDFDKTVAKHGWQYNGSRSWRTNVIFQTNVATAYQAGRYKQMFDPDVLKQRPYLQYHHGGSRDPRLDHLSWDGLVLPHDDPFWKTHRPKNGWGCKCYVTSHSKGDLKRMGKDVPDVAPNIEIDKLTGVPQGIDKGWDYDPASTAWGRPLSKRVMETWQNQGHEAWESLTPGNWESEGRPKSLSFVKSPKKQLSQVSTIAESETRLKNILNADEKIFKLPNGSRVLVNAESLAGHMALNRSGFIPFLPELLENPDEIWLSFQRHKGTGKILLRQRIVKAVEIDKGRYLLMVAQSQNGIFEAWTFIPTNKANYINRQRRGKLIYAKK